MNAAKLIKLAPMIIMIGFLTYSGYSIQTSADDPEAGQSGLAKELDVVVHDIVAASDAIKEGASGALRDPFQVTLKEAVPAGVAASKGQGPLEPEPDPLAEIVRRLNLGATFLQGREQLAIIDGRIYSKGQHLLVDGDNGKTFSKLYVVNVLPTKVILHADGVSYVLVYSDQLGDRDDHARKGGEEGSQNAMAEIDPGGELAMFQKLLNSPLGALGKRVIGDPARTSSRSGSSRSKRARRPRSTANSSASP